LSEKRKQYQNSKIVSSRPPRIMNCLELGQLINTRKLHTIGVDAKCIAVVLVNQSYFKSLSEKRDEHDRNINDSTLAQVHKHVHVSLGETKGKIIIIECT
jgi:hypothetical protein